MAVATTSYTSSTCPRVTLTVVEESTTGNSTTYKYTLAYVTNGSTLHTSLTKQVTASIGGTSVYSSAITVGYKTSYTIKTDTITVAKTHAAQTLTISVSIAWGSATWSGTTLGTKSGSTTMSLSAATSYAVKYNANGGSGAPASQTKWYGETLTLSDEKPTRTGYTFSKWNTAAAGTGTGYAAGAKYTANAAATLYAQWTANKYTITLNANGGTGGTASVTKTYGASVTLPSLANSPTRTNYKFLGWAATKDAKSAQWAAGASYTNNITAATTLYAVWELAYIAPSISGFTAYRCDAVGVKSDDDTYALITFDWTIDTSIDDTNAMESVTVAIDGIVVYSATGGGTSGTVSTIVPDISTDLSYTIAATVTDTYESGTPTTKSGVVESAKYLIDIAAGGNGIGIGTIAPAEGMKIGMPVWAEKDVTIATAASEPRLVFTREDQNIAAKIYLQNSAKGSLAFATSATGDPSDLVYVACINDNGISPYTNDTFDLGTSSRIWSRLYVRRIYAPTPSGDVGIYFEPQSETGNTVVGYSNYLNANGNTNLYGNDVVIFSAAAGKVSYRPYYRAGDTISCGLHTAGYVTTNGTIVRFAVPLSRPIIGSPTPTITVASNNGFTLRQNNLYTHGSSATTYVSPSTYSATYTGGTIIITATFDNTTNVTNNSPIGIVWSGTITLS